VNLDVSGASAFWVDGKSAQPGETQFSAGEHVLAVALQKNALPSVLKASATAARFIAP
jgi:hypothetical protein